MSTETMNLYILDTGIFCIFPVHIFFQQLMVAREKKKANNALQLEGFQSKFIAVVLFGIFYTLIGDICILFIIEKLLESLRSVLASRHCMS